jgi:hypothetical protein
VDKPILVIDTYCSDKIVGLIKKLVSVSIQGKAYISPEKRGRYYFFTAKITDSGFSFIDGQIIADFMFQKEFGKLPFPVWLAMKDPP